MNTFSIASHSSTRRFSFASCLFKRFPYPHQFALTQTLAFSFPKSLRTSSPNSLQRFRVSFKPPSSDISAEPQLSDAEEDYDDDDDDDVAADEYDEISGELSEDLDPSDEEIDIPIAEDEDASTRPEESKWQRVEKLINEVREFGDEVIDVNELASIYDFRIDKFQVQIFQFAYKK